MRNIGWLICAVAIGGGLWLARLGYDHFKEQRIGLTGIHRVSFIGAVARDCDESPDHASIPKERRDRYCNCHAAEMASRLSNARMQDILKLDRAEQSRALQPVADASNAPCAEWLEAK